MGVKEQRQSKGLWFVLLVLGLVIVLMKQHLSFRCTAGSCQAKTLPTAEKHAAKDRQREVWQAEMESTHLYCKQMLDVGADRHTGNPVPANARRHAIKVPELPQPIYMYLVAGSDIVSNEIVRGGWERSLTQFILGRLRASDRHSPLFVDIGANVGTHAIQVAAAGFRTLAIEAAPTNQALLRATYCANQHVLRNLTIIGTALGYQTETCGIWALPSNTGNGSMYCNTKPPSSMVRLGEASTKRLDDLLAETVEVMKLDVQGFEGRVLAGATHLLATARVVWLTFEFSPAAIVNKGGDPFSLLAMVIAAGFDCVRANGASRYPSQWQYLAPEALLQLAQKPNLVDLLCKRRRAPYTL